VRWPEDHALAIGEIGAIRAGQREPRLLITGYAENRLRDARAVRGRAGAERHACDP
jgi:hypothetical protein